MPQKHRFYCLFCLLILFGALPARAQVPDSAAPPPAAATSCTPVAKLFGHDICREDISMEKQHIEAVKQQYEKEGIDPEQALRTREMDRLRQKIWDTALIYKFGKPALEPDDEEINAFSDAFQKSLEDSQKENLKTAARIKELLATEKFDADQTRKLKSLLATLQTSIAYYQQREQYKKNMPPEFNDMIAKTERGMAETMMREWKKNKALYDEYGGQLAQHEGALEPVDAYSKFLDYIRTTGGLEILDPAYNDVFKETELFISAKHEPPPQDEEDIYKNYFAAPQWQLKKNTETDAEMRQEEKTIEAN